MAGCTHLLPVKSNCGRVFQECPGLRHAADKLIQELAALAVLQHQVAAHGPRRLLKICCCWCLAWFAAFRRWLRK